ncbi:wax ester/triacylglycerol synthase domain-containing protein [Georgenia daeguensis]|uniref:diacylglycerol O-acyltransferase n=1 Tax=Georgenia daeguensis TaxID=908355 RepID=A0ABP8EWG3_9MICO
MDAADRLTALDVTNLVVESHGAPMHVAALAVLDGASLLDPSTGEPRVGEVRAHVGERLPRRLRQRLVVPPRGRGRPHWAAPSAVDLSRHVRTQEVQAPADETALLELCCRLNERPLDRRHPLWEMWLLTGLGEGRVGLLIRLHHVIADGVAALALLGSFLDPAPGGSPAEAEGSRATTPEGRAGAKPRSDDGGAGSQPPAVAGAAEPGRQTPAGRGALAAWVAAAVGLAAARVAQIADLVRAGRTPALSFNRPVGGRTRIVLARADLGRTKAVAHAHGGKVNDVVLAAVGGGARRLLAERGELTDDLTLRVSVIASLRGARTGVTAGATAGPTPVAGAAAPPSPAETAGGNRTGVRVIPLPVSEPDPVRRLERIVAATAAQRSRPPMQPGGRLLRHGMVAVMRRQRMVNLLLTNLPGPPEPLIFAGAPVLEMFQLGQNQGNLGISVGVLSYAGTLGIDVVADAELVPDVETFAAGLTDTLEALGAM